MPILKIENTPYYLTISELSKLPIIEKLVMYEKKELRNKSFDKKDEKILTEYISDNIGDRKEHRFLYVDLVKKEAECAITELMLYHIYFYCKQTVVIGYNRTVDTTSDQMTLNDLVFPYTTWNAEIIFDNLTLKSGDSYFKLEYHKIERIVGSYKRFKIILTDCVLTFSFGKIYIEPRTIYTSLSVDNYTSMWKENKPFHRLLNKSDRRNYKPFVFYLNDKYIYSNYDHPRFYNDYASYKKVNFEIFE